MIHRRFYYGLAFCAVITCLATANVGLAQEDARVSRLDDLNLPTNPQAWINSAPITKNMLRGKAAIFYLYEEGCPKCAAKWPGIMALANKNKSYPVVIIGVNSGTSPAGVASYVRQKNIKIPVIIDPNRTLEKQLISTEISLQNVYQAAVIGADGRIFPASGGDMDASVTRALATNPSWKIDPTGMPQELLPAWQAIEFGTFSTSSRSVIKGLNSRDPKVKTAAEKLNNYVQTNLQAKLTTADTANATEETKFTAYQIYSELRIAFKGYELPPRVNTNLKELAKNATVKNELSAFKRYQAAVKYLGSSSEAARRRGKKTLETLITQEPNTQAALKAKEAIGRLN
ncbi:MAG: hypothetical protein COA78_25475 [Blastopirellula sp.]|nr:MAG: hypothetical protein COA78_25475 [Blastopirellula sp.]